ncbi:MAG: BTAD domain-containing putative transcriptional regulator [Candidatus Nanopelagicales bacterium]
MIDGNSVGGLAPQQRRLLSLLASAPGQALGREWLARGLWESADPSHLRSLQVHISHLRAALGRDAIESVGHSYRLVIAPDDVDEVRFRLLVAEGKEAVAHGHYDDGISLLEDALGLWRGDPYEDLATDEFRARRAGLGELRSSAEDALLRARVELIRDVNDAESVIPLSTCHFAEQPSRESRAVLHMRCLMAAGRLTDAAAVAAGFRRRMHREVGVEPGTEFAEIVVRIMRRDPTLMPAAWRSRVSLPDHLIPLIGRDHEHGLAVSLVKWNSAQVLCITGQQGVGKSRLAASVAETLGPGLPGGVLWLGEDHVRDSEAVIARVAELLGLRGSPAEMRQGLAAALGRRRTLVVLDGVREDAVMSAVAILLSAGSQVSILLTGIQRLGLASEHEMRLHPFSLVDGSAESFVREVVHFLGAEPRAVDGRALEESGGLPSVLEQMAISMMSEAVRA